MRQTVGRQTNAKCLRNDEAKKANSDDIVSTYFVRTGHVARIKNLFFNEILLNKLRHSKLRLIVDVIAEILKLKTCSVGNLFKYIYTSELRLISQFVTLPVPHYPKAGENYKYWRLLNFVEHNWSEFW